MHGVLVGVIVLAGCVESAIVQCDDGRVCPAGTTCDAVHGCTTPAQLQACAGMADGTTCTYAMPDDGLCDGGVCVPSRCGDGYLRAGEDCDVTAFGAVASCQQRGFYDDVPLACKADCTLDESVCTGFCGDGVVQSPTELCEPGTPPPLTCVDLGYGAGYLDCSSQCGPGLTDCKLLGWQTYFFDGLINDVHGASDANIWTVGSMFVSRFDGAAWHDVDVSACPLTSSLSYSFSAVFTLGADTFVGTTNGKVAHLSSSGCAAALADTLETTVTDLWAADTSNVIAATLGGTYRFNGSAWTSLDAEPSTSVWGTAANDFYVVSGSPGQLVHYTGTWSTITKATLGITGDVAAVWGTSASDVFISTSAAEIQHWNGSNWSSASQGMPSVLGGIDIGATVGTITFARGIYNVFARLGTEWVDLQMPQAVTSSPAGRIWASPGGSLFAVDDSRLNVFRGNTRSTEQVFPNFPGADRVVVRGPNDAFALRQGALYVWDGVAWDSDSSTSFDDIARAADGTMFAVNGSGLWTRAAADNWTPISNSVGGKRLWARTATDIWILATDQASLRHWTGTNTNYTFTNVTYILSAWIVGANDAYAVHPNTLGGTTVEHWNGSSWSVAYTATAFAEFMWGIGPHIYIVSYSDGMLVHFDGTTWSEGPTLPGTMPVTLWGTGPDDLFIGGRRLIHYDGAHWSPVSTGDPTLAIGSIDGNAYAVFYTDQEGVHRIVRTQSW